MPDSPYVYILVGAMTMIVIGHWFPSLKNMSSLNSINSVSSVNNLEQIQGIDLRALSLCKNKGLM